MSMGFSKQEYWGGLPHSPREHGRKLQIRWGVAPMSRVCVVGTVDFKKGRFFLVGMT